MFYISTGGTGGHVFPALRIFKEMQSRGYSVILCRDERSVSYFNDFENVYDIITINLRRSSGKVKFFLSVIYETFCMIVRFIRDRPKALIAFGGYSSIPALVAAKISGTRIILHEQNRVWGNVTKIFSTFSSVVCLSFPEKNIEYKIGKNTDVLHLGNPVDAVFFQSNHEKHKKSRILRNKRFLAVVGGSQGADELDKKITDAIGKLTSEQRSLLYVVHQCRLENLEQLKAKYRAMNVECNLMPFFDDIAKIFRDSDLLICRAGALTLSEAAASGIPFLTLPYVFAKNDHQTANAEYFSANGGSYMLGKNNSSSSIIAEKISDILFDDEVLSNMSQKLLETSNAITPSNFVNLLEDKKIIFKG